MDTQRDTKARQKLESLKLKGIDIVDMDKGVNTPKPKFAGKCFNCDRVGHMQRECRSPPRKQTCARAAQENENIMDEGETLVDWTRQESYDLVQSALRTISVLSDEEKQALIRHMNNAGEQDFQTA